MEYAIKASEMFMMVLITQNLRAHVRIRGSLRVEEIGRCALG